MALTNAVAGRGMRYALAVGPFGIWQRSWRLGCWEFVSADLRGGGRGRGIRSTASRDGIAASSNGKYAELRVYYRLHALRKHAPGFDLRRVDHSEEGGFDESIRRSPKECL